MKSLPASLVAWRGPAALALLLFRLHLGVVMVEAGWPKLGLPDWFTRTVAKLGFTWPAPVLWAGLAAWGELAGGILLILGLGTRWAAAQLAFQFAVISFLWYDKPEFFTGMYVQQELFWGFVLLLGTGAGRWSADAWLRGRSVGQLLAVRLVQQPVVAAAVLLLLPVLAGARPVGSVRSDLFIEPGKQFILGGGQPGEFRVVAKNVGPVPVEFQERPRGGGIFGKAILAPGQRAVLRFAAGATAVLLNPSRSQAHLDLTITGDNKQLRMDYEPVRSDLGPAPAPRLTGAELSDALAAWSGTLTYRDYRSQKTTVLPTRARGEMTRPDQLLLHFDYEESSTRHVFGTDTLTVAPGGAHLRWDGTDYAIQSKQWLPDQTLRLVLEGEAQDNDRPATIRKILTLGPHQLTVKKEVRPGSEAAFFQRHQYQFTR